MLSLSPTEVSRNRTKYTPLYIPDSPRPVAFLDGCVLRKTIQPQHMLRRPPAIAFDWQLLRQAQKWGATKIRVECGSDWYEAPMSLFNEHRFDVNRGFGDQVALELGWWKKNGAEAVRVQRATQQTSRERLMSLFDFDTFDDEGGAA